MRSQFRQWTGEPITEPGIYSGVPIGVYHGAGLCDAPSISSSGLRTIEGQSPAHYWCHSPYNPEREEDDGEAEALVFGRAAHMLLLGEEGFRETFAVRPDEFTAWTTKAAKAWRTEQQESGRSVLIPSNLDAIRGMAKSMARDPIISNGLLAGDIETTLVWRDAETGVWLKARPDSLPRDRVIVDLKTCASADALACRRAIGDHGYHMQLALTGMGIEALTGEAPGNDDYVLVFVEKTAPYAINIKPLDPEAVHFGRLQLRRAITTFARCMESGDWPAYADNLIPASLLPFTLKRLQEEADMGMLPEEKAA